MNNTTRTRNAAWLAVLFTLPFLAKSQCPAGNSCYSAPLVCGNVLNGLALSTGGPNELSQPSSFCGIIENNQWIAFVACQPTAILGLNITSCAGTFTGSGLQAQVFQSADCEAFTPVSNCFSPGTAVNGTLTATGLTPGGIYYLMVDGWAGDICSYTVSVVSGIDVQPPAPTVSQPGNIAGPTEVCPNQTATFSANLPVCTNQSSSGCPLPPAAQTADLTYSWQIPPGATIVGDPNSSTINVIFGSAGGTVSVNVSGQTSGDCGCDWNCPTTIPPINVNVQNTPSNIVQLPPVVICEGESYEFCGITYTTSASPICLTNGCQDATQQPINVLPNTVTNLGQQILCGSACFEIGGQSFCDPGTFSVQTQNNGACETVNFTTTEVFIDGYWSPTNVIHPAMPEATLNGGGSSNGGATNGQVTYQWSGSGIQPGDETAEEPTVTSGGSYVVIVTDVATGCTFTDTIIVYQQTHDCNLPASPGNFCEIVPTFCGSELDGYCSFTGDFTGENLGNLATVFCAGIENSAFLKFIPCEPTVLLEILPEECADTNGIEAMILETSDCQFFTAKSNCLAGKQLDTLTATNLTPGKPYFLMVDGRFGDQCKWSLKVIDGIRTEPIEVVQVSPPVVSGPDKACPGETKQYSLQPPDCQVVSAGNCPFNALLDSLEIKWFVPPGAQILGDSTALNVSVKWNAGPGGDVFCIVKTALTSAETFCVALNGCSDFAKQKVDVKFTTTTLPPILRCEGQSATVCGNLITATQDVVCPDVCGQIIQPVIFTKPKREDFGEIKICPGASYIFDGKSYSNPGFYQVLAQNGACMDTVQFTVSQNAEPPFDITAVQTVCDNIGATYKVKFDFTMGIPPFFVNGVKLPGASFQSAPMVNQQPYSFLLKDSRTCGDSSFIVIGTRDCACVSFAGTMVLDTLATCPPNALTVNHLGGEILDADDFTEFVLHTGNADSLATILGINQSGTFNLLPTMTAGQTYFVSLVAGNSIDGGYVDLTDRCLSVAVGQPIVFWPTPVADAGPDLLIDCSVLGSPLLGNSTAGSPQGVDYQWVSPTDPNFLSTEKQPFVNAPGSFQLTVSDKITGCTSSDLVEVAQQIVPPGVAAADEILTCTAPLATLLATSPTANSTFFWVNNVGDTLFQNPIKTTAPGNFEAFATGPNGCISQKTVVVADGRQPIPHTALGGAIDCQVIDIQLVATAGLPNCAFDWTGPNGFSSNLQSPMANQPGLYFLKITDPTAGCSALDTVEILDNRKPISTTATGGEINCSQGQTTLGATAGLPNCTFEWAGPGGFLSQSQTPATTAPGLYFLKITGQIPGCFGFDTVAVLDNRKPISTTATGGNIDCYLPDIQLVTTVVLPNCSFLWTGPGSFSSIEQSPKVGAGGLYFLKITGAVAGCFGGDTVEVKDLRIYPTAKILPPDTLTCLVKNVPLDGSPSSAGPTFIFEWNSPSGAVIFGKNQSIAATNSPGDFVLKVTDVQNGCTDEAATFVFENTNLPTALDFAENDPNCAGFSDGSIEILGVSGGEPPLEFALDSGSFSQHMLFENLPMGVFNLKIRDKNGCIFEKTATLTDPPPVLVSLGPDLEIGLGESIELAANSTWDFADLPIVEWSSWPMGFEKTGGSELEAAPLTSTYFTILVENGAGCADLDTVLVKIRRDVPIYVPTAFSPNGDGLNDFLEIYAGGGVQKIRHFEVFDRWGERVFEAADFLVGDQNAGWDGQFLGKKAPPAVYIWWAEIELVDGRRVLAKGDFGLVR